MMLHSLSFKGLVPGLGLDKPGPTYISFILCKLCVLSRTPPSSILCTLDKDVLLFYYEQYSVSMSYLAVLSLAYIEWHHAS